MHACVHTHRKGSHHAHRVEKHSTKWKGCLPHNLNTRATRGGSSEQSSGRSSWGPGREPRCGHKWGKIPPNQDMLLQRFQRHAFYLFGFCWFCCFLFVCLSVWRRLDPSSCSTSHHCSRWVPGWELACWVSLQPPPTPAPSAMISRGPSIPLGEPLPCHIAGAHSFPKMND